MAYDAARDRTILFGGTPQDPGRTSVNDTWAWDGDDWTELKPASSPPARTGGKVAYDRARRSIVLWGGSSYEQSSPASRRDFGDTWEFDGETWHQRAETGPAQGSAAGLTYVPANRGLILVSGSKTWLWDGEKWSQLSPPTPPTPYGLDLTYDAARGVAVLVASQQRFNAPGELWTWDGTTWEKSGAPSPAARDPAVFQYHPAAERVLMYAGAGCGVFDDQWTWDGTSWTETDLGERAPRARSYSQMAFDSDRDRSVLFGGYGSQCDDVSDTWTWDGGVWTQIRPKTSPPGRSWASMAHDPARQETGLFGGRLDAGADSRANDTWIFDGTDWTQRLPSVRPPAREAATMAFDAISRKLVLFGGATCTTVPTFGCRSTFQNDTWTWDGTTWTREQPKTSPPQRTYAAMARDADGRPVLFGGLNELGGELADTWRWNGSSSNWELISGPTPASTAPPGRYGAGMGYDARSGRIILFGHPRLRDTWAFRGQGWQKLEPATPPPARFFPTMADGSETNPPIVFGGANDRDTWVWGTPAAVPTDPSVTAPVTTATHDPPEPDGEAGWYRSPVRVSLSAVDDEPGAISTEYKLDGSDWQPYEGPFTVGADGEHTLAYRSTDRAGNREEPKSLSFKIDRTPPATQAALDPPRPDSSTREGWYRSGVTVTLTPADTWSGPAPTRYALDDGGDRTYTGPFTVDGGGEHTVSYWSTDKAGNAEERKSVSFKIDRPPSAQGRSVFDPPAAERLLGALDPGTSGRGARPFLISRRALALTRRGAAGVRVSCRQRPICRGVLTLRASARSRRGGRARSIVLGKRRFRVAGMRRGVVSVRLAPGRRRLVLRVRRTRVRATATLERGARPRRWTTRSSFRLVRPRTVSRRSR